MVEEKLNLAAKLAKISNEIGKIAKDGHNREQHYDFIAYADVAANIRTKHAEVGIAIVPQIDGYIKDEVRSSKGGMGFHYLLDMTFQVINTDNPNDKLEMKWVGEATDYGDKGVNKAITSATKYFIMRLYNISEKGENDEPTPESDKTSGRMDEISKSNASAKSFKVDFNEVRATLPGIETVEDLEDYWKSLGKISDKTAKFLQPMFAKRKKELNELAG